MPRRKNNPQPPRKYSIDSCKYCQRSHLKLSKCSKCKEVFYCSVDCQKKDWIHHKKICKPEEIKQQSPPVPSVDSTLPVTCIEEESCNNCGKSDVKLSICSRCQGVQYCSKECQKAEWSKHKVNCKKNSLPTSCTSSKSNQKCHDCSNISADGSEFCDSCQLTKSFENMYSQRPKCSDCPNVSETDSAYCAKCIKMKFFSMNPFFLITSKQKCRDCPSMSTANSVYCYNCVASKYSKTISIVDKFAIQECRDCLTPCDQSGYCIQCLMRKTSGNMFSLKVPDEVYQIAETRYPGFKLITDFNDIDKVLNKKIKLVLLAVMIGHGGHSFRPSMILRDTKGMKLRLIFHLKKDDQPDPKKWNSFDIGNFICIIYPNIHHFADGSVGFRLESTNLVSFIKCFRK